MARDAEAKIEDGIRTMWTPLDHAAPAFGCWEPRRDNASGPSVVEIDMPVRDTDAADGSGELELKVRDRGCFFVRAPGEADCHVFLEYLGHRADGQLLEFFTVRGVPAVVFR